MLEKIIELCTKHAFVLPVKHRVNGSIVTCYNFGPMGAAFSHNFLQEWWFSVVATQDSVYPVTTSALTASSYREKKDAPTISGENVYSFLPTSLSRGTLSCYPHILQLVNNQLPFGIAHYGKCFVSGNINKSKFIYRSPEFTELILQYFTSGNDTNMWFDHWVQNRLRWWKRLSSYPSNFAVVEAEESSEGHQQVHINFKFPWGQDVVETIAMKGEEPFKEYDSLLKNTKGKKQAVPQLIESSTILEHGMLAYLVDAYGEIAINDDTEKVKKVLCLHPKLAPYKVAVASAHSKQFSTPELKEVADYVSKELSKAGIMVLYVKEYFLESIYSRIDETSVPFCIIIDEKTLDTGVLSLRSRDTTLKEQVHLSQVIEKLTKILESY